MGWGGGGREERGGREREEGSRTRCCILLRISNKFESQMEWNREIVSVLVTYVFAQSEIIFIKSVVWPFSHQQSLELNTSVLRRHCCTVLFLLFSFSLNSIKNPSKARSLLWFLQPLERKGITLDFKWWRALARLNLI